MLEDAGKSSFAIHDLPLTEIAATLNVAANSSRLELLFFLLDGPRSTEELSEQIPGERKSLSAQIEVLNRAGLISSRRHGKICRYDLTPLAARFVRTLQVAFSTGPKSSSVAAPDLAGRNGDSAADELDRLHALLKALADPVRLRILSLLASDDGVCVCHLHQALQLPQSTVSRHLSALRAAGLVKGARKGKWVKYRLADSNRSIHLFLFDRILNGLSGSRLFNEDRKRLVLLAGDLPCEG